MSDQLLTAKEAAKLLKVSFPTFQKICKQYGFNQIRIGQRIKYSHAEIIKVMGGIQPSVISNSTLPPLDFTILTDTSVQQLEIEKGVFDLRTVKVLDPYGVVSLLCTFIDRCKAGKSIELLIEDNRTSQYLRSIGFFDELEAECGGKIGWDRTLLRSPSTFQDETTLVPIKGIKLKGNERMIAENLIELLKKQGFSVGVGRKIAHIIGELADNALTHSHEQLSQRRCFILAKRFLYGESNCVIVGLGDIGRGIPNSLKTNPKHKTLSDEDAFVTAFRPYVSSWDDSAGRGKGLADVLGIAWGNKSFLRVDSGPIGLFMNFEASPKIAFRKPITQVAGTRYGIVLLDNDFDRHSRDEVEKLIFEAQKEL